MFRIRINRGDIGRKYPLYELALHRLPIAIVSVVLILATAIIPAASSVTIPPTVSNPSFEIDLGGWTSTSLFTRGESELFAAPDGTAFAQLEAPSSIEQDLGVEMVADTEYTTVVWTRSVNAHVPKSTGKKKGMQKTHPNPLAKAKLSLKRPLGSGGLGDIASAEIVVSPNATVVADGGVNAHDDGGNVFFAGDYRMHLANSLLYQKRATADPISDEWQQGNENEYWGMAVGPVSDLDGYLVIQAIGGGHTRTDLSPEDIDNGMRVSSRIEINALEGTAPDFYAPPPTEWDMNDQPIFDTVLSHLDDEAPWVFDPHYCYDDKADRLYMTWGGHSTFLTEVDTLTGHVVDPNTGEEPTTGTEFNKHAKGVHTKILTNQPWRGLPMYKSTSEAPDDWEGDAFSTQAYMEGVSLLKHGDYFFACGTYGSMGDSYTIRCCRQDASEPTAPRGPYVNQQGKVCTEFDPDTDRYPAKMLLGPDGDHLVPGHPHFWREYDADGGEMLYLGYDFRDQIPSVKEDSMAIRRLYFDDGGWPTVWTPLTVTVDTGSMPELVGKRLTIELSAGGDTGSKVAFDHVSVTTSPATTGPPTASPTPEEECTETEGDRYFFGLKSNKKPKLRSCRSLEELTKKARKKICSTKVVYYGKYSPPQDTCPITCDSCKPCYENENSKFFYKLKKKKEKPVFKTCGWLAKNKNTQKHCKKKKASYEGYGPPSRHCPMTCSTGSC